MAKTETICGYFYTRPELRKSQVTGAALQMLKEFIKESLLENYKFEPIRAYRYIRRKKRNER